ncbi:MAG: Siroheme synthase : Uroporphyrinogen-III C-methyltransferase [Pseudomonadota bacterium]|jgi:uroporphyrin-III C-methyltransferase/precorrin-2 dehydrogenase/sirohydrochlorin ferrochelatase
MDYFPIFLKLSKQPCLVVGAGSCAARKIELLSRAGADITVVAHDISTQVAGMQVSHHLTIYRKYFEPADLADFKLVISATNDKLVNENVSKCANKAGIWVNVVDSPTLCNFIFPAIVDRAPLTIAISSGGVSPVLARLLRQKIETVIPPTYGILAKLAEKFRDTVKKQISIPSNRRIFWENVLQGRVAELIFAGQNEAAERELTYAISQIESEINNANNGEVYLIGAGPGAADLLTFRALRLMQQADVIVYDRLVSAEILDLARRDSDRIYVGKERSQHALPQEEINELLVKLAKEGKRVARVKGGDPFIFGRGGEEIETLMEQNIAFQVVPGITAANGCASYAGIPLTHRDYAQSCVFVTGHLKDDSINLNWTQLAMPNQTIVIYMGLIGLEKICNALILHGSDPMLPIAVVEKGTTAQQRVIIGTLSTLPNKIRHETLKAPTLIIIGNVVSLHEKLNWFGHK